MTASGENIRGKPRSSSFCFTVGFQSRFPVLARARASAARPRFSGRLLSAMHSPPEMTVGMHSRNSVPAWVPDRQRSRRNRTCEALVHVMCLKCAAAQTPAQTSCLTASLPQPVKFPGCKMRTYTHTNSIFDGPNTSLLSILCTVIGVLSGAHAKRKKDLNDFQFGTSVGHFGSDGEASVAAKAG